MEEIRKQQLLSLGKYSIMALITLSILLLYRECGRDQGLLPAQKEFIDNVITDTSYKEKYQALKKLYDIKAKPSKVIIYDTVYIPTIKWVSYNTGDDNVIITPTGPDSTEILYDTRFLTLYPTASKLLEFDLKKDLLVINTLGTNGELSSRTYPLLLDNMNYQWYDNELHRSPFTPLKSKFKDNIRYKGLYTNAGYDLFSSRPNLGIEYNLEIYRFKLDGEINTTFQNTNPLEAKVKIGYRLFK
jgi:hypothetical protein